jgi:hypothetical protein
MTRFAQLSTFNSQLSTLKIDHEGKKHTAAQMLLPFPVPVHCVQAGGRAGGLPHQYHDALRGKGMGTCVADAERERVRGPQTADAPVCARKDRRKQALCFLDNYLKRVKWRTYTSHINAAGVALSALPAGCWKKAAAMRKRC